mgnify:CR=1 FL=1
MKWVSYRHHRQWPRRQRLQGRRDAGGIEKTLPRLKALVETGSATSGCGW